jgi:hypothetical protein
MQCCVPAVAVRPWRCFTVPSMQHVVAWDSGWRSVTGNSAGSDARVVSILLGHCGGCAHNLIQLLGGWMGFKN